MSRATIVAEHFAGPPQAREPLALEALILVGLVGLRLHPTAKGVERAQTPVRARLVVVHVEDGGGAAMPARRDERPGKRRQVEAEHVDQVEGHAGELPGRLGERAGVANLDSNGRGDSRSARARFRESRIRQISPKSVSPAASTARTSTRAAWRAAHGVAGRRAATGTTSNTTS